MTDFTKLMEQVSSHGAPAQPEVKPATVETEIAGEAIQEVLSRMQAPQQQDQGFEEMGFVAGMTNPEHRTITGAALRYAQLNTGVPFFDEEKRDREKELRSQGLTTSDIALVLQNDAIADFQARYGDEETRSASGDYYTGVVGSYIADPLGFIPIFRAGKAGAAAVKAGDAGSDAFRYTAATSAAEAGAVTGGYVGAYEESFGDGFQESDTLGLFAATAAGGILGAGLHKLGQTFTGWFGKEIAENGQVTVESARQWLDSLTPEQRAEVGVTAEALSHRLNSTLPKEVGGGRKPIAEAVQQETDASILAQIRQNIDPDAPEGEVLRKIAAQRAKLGIVGQTEAAQGARKALDNPFDTPWYREDSVLPDEDSLRILMHEAESAGKKANASPEVRYDDTPLWNVNMGGTPAKGFVNLTNPIKKASYKVPQAKLKVQGAEYVPTQSLGALLKGLPMKMKDSNMQTLANDIARNGIKDPIKVTVSTANGRAVISEGSHRLAVAESLGVTDVPVIVSMTRKPIPNSKGGRLTNPRSTLSEGTRLKLGNPKLSKQKDGAYKFKTGKRNFKVQPEGKAWKLSSRTGDKGSYGKPMSYGTRREAVEAAMNIARKEGDVPSGAVQFSDLVNVKKIQGYKPIKVQTADEVVAEVAPQHIAEYRTALEGATPEFKENPLEHFDGIHPESSEARAALDKDLRDALDYSEGEFSPVLNPMHAEANELADDLSVAMKESLEKPSIEQSTTRGAEFIWANPSKRFRQSGAFGKEFDLRMTRVQDETRELITTFWSGMFDWAAKKGFNSRSAEKRLLPLLDEAANINRKILDPKDADPLSKELAEYMRQQFRKVINDAHQAGRIDNNARMELLTRAAEKGYFPRVLDVPFLKTKKGEQEFTQILLNKEMSRDQAEQVLNRVLKQGDMKVNFDDFFQITGSKGYTIKNDKIGDVYKQTILSTLASRSTHLDKPRIFPEHWEKDLARFYIQDTKAIMNHYLFDVYTAINHAKYFGSKDQIFWQLLSQANQTEAGRKVVQGMKEAYFISARDIGQSATLKGAALMSEKRRRFTAMVQIYETFKLARSQIVNFPQAIVNGTVMNVKHEGVVRGMMTSIESITRNATSRKQRQWATSVGADYQAFISQQIGALYAHQHTFLGRDLTGWMSPFNIFNNPGTFLKYSGFVATEQWNRSLGATMGQGVVKRAAQKYVRLAEKPPHTLTKADIAAQKRAGRTLMELGINPRVLDEKGLAGLTRREWNLASQSYSNKLNFVQDPHKLPFLLQNAEAKIFFIFKSFVAHHTNFVAENVVKPLMRGDPIPMLTYLGVGTVAGMGVLEALALTKGVEQDFDSAMDFANALGRVGGFGVAMDVALGTQYGQNPITAFLGGPAFSDADKMLTGAATAFKQDSIEPFIESVLKTNPLTRKLAE